jgi:hypothetical protein
LNKKDVAIILLLVSVFASAQIELFEKDQSGLYFERENNIGYDILSHIGYVHEAKIAVGIKSDYHRDFASDFRAIGPEVEYKLFEQNKRFPVDISISADYQLGVFYAGGVCFTHSAMIQSKVYRRFKISGSFYLIPSAQVSWRYYIVDHDYRLGRRSSVDFALNCKINVWKIHLYPQFAYISGYSHLRLGFGFKIPFKGKE